MLEQKSMILEDQISHAQLLVCLLFFGVGELANLNTPKTKKQLAGNSHWDFKTNHLEIHSWKFVDLFSGFTHANV